jgi:hypothetical protein
LCAAWIPNFATCGSIGSIGSQKMTWKDPPIFQFGKPIFFRLGPSKNHGEL